jgi:hypothetical protein
MESIPTGGKIPGREWAMGLEKLSKYIISSGLQQIFSLLVV